MIAPSDTGIYGRLHVGPTYEMTTAGSAIPAMRRCFAVLKPESAMREIFPQFPAPLVSAEPKCHQGEPFFHVELARCTPEQIATIARWIVSRCPEHAARPLEEIAAALRRSGFWPMPCSNFSAVVVVELSGGLAR